MVERFSLRPGYEISRVIRGGWQLAGGHGTFDRREAVEDLAAYCEAGIFTFDCADIYTGVEELIGEFRTSYAKRHGREALGQVKVHTKFVPDLEELSRLDRGKVRATIDRSLARLRCERLDLVQFHWWDYAVPGLIEAALWLEDFRIEGKIDLIGGTNFDTPYAVALVAAGVPLASMQVQYSLLDDRPENGLVQACERLGIRLLCYGTVAGGFLSDAWLGRPEPQPPFENRSLTKYKLVIDDFGGWALFQELLRTLRRIADRHGSDIAIVASRAILDRPMVAAVIVGARNRAHLAANVGISECAFSDDDRAEIGKVLAKREGPEGDTFTPRARPHRQTWIDHEIQSQPAGRMSASPSLAEKAWQEVVELHDFFVAWMHGDEFAKDFSRAEAAIGENFSMISPDGKTDDREAVVAWIKGARGSRPKPFSIVARDPRTIWAGEGAVLLEYTEEQYRNARTTRRRSTALFLANPAAPCGVEWCHLQETWLDAG